MVVKTDVCESGYADLYTNKRTGVLTSHSCYFIIAVRQVLIIVTFKPPQNLTATRLYSSSARYIVCNDEL